MSTSNPSGEDLIKDSGSHGSRKVQYDSESHRRVTHRERIPSRTWDPTEDPIGLSIPQKKRNLSAEEPTQDSESQGRFNRSMHNVLKWKGVRMWLRYKKDSDEMFL